MFQRKLQTVHEYHKSQYFESRQDQQYFFFFFVSASLCLMRIPYVASGYQMHLISPKRRFIDIVTSDKGNYHYMRTAFCALLQGSVSGLTYHCRHQSTSLITTTSRESAFSLRHKAIVGTYWVTLLKRYRSQWWLRCLLQIGVQRERWGCGLSCGPSPQWPACSAAPAYCGCGIWIICDHMATKFRCPRTRKKAREGSLDISRRVNAIPLSKTLRPSTLCPLAPNLLGLLLGTSKVEKMQNWKVSSNISPRLVRSLVESQGKCEIILIYTDILSFLFFLF